MITIIDYGLGNLRSVQKAFERCNVIVKISSKPGDIKNAEKLLLPGVGHFAEGMRNIKEYGILDAMNIAVLENKTPIMGICLGMQLMTDYSEEGNCKGLGWISGKTKKFNFETNGLKIPHMGWNNLLINNNSTIFKGISQQQFFYFVHSYYVTCESKSHILAETDYGGNFVSSFNHNNIYGCQFHPEKSHDAGLLLIKNFTLL